MAVDKLVDSTQLNTNLTNIANAIRTKGGTSAQIAFPGGFVSAIVAIPTGSGADISALDVYIADFLTNPPIVTEGAIDTYRRILVS